MAFVRLFGFSVGYVSKVTSKVGRCRGLKPYIIRELNGPSLIILMYIIKLIYSLVVIHERRTS